MLTILFYSLIRILFKHWKSILKWIFITHISLRSTRSKFTTKCNKNINNASFTVFCINFFCLPHTDEMLRCVHTLKDKSRLNQKVQKYSDITWTFLPWLTNNIPIHRMCSIIMSITYTLKSIILLRKKNDEKISLSFDTHLNHMLKVN